MKLKQDVPVKTKIETFILRAINKEKLYEFLREMEFNRLLSQVISNYGDSAKEKIKISEGSAKFDLKKYETILKINDLEKLIQKIEEQGVVAVDTETNSLNPHEADLVGISLCYNTDKSFYIPLEHATDKTLDKRSVLERLKKILEDKSIKKIGQNIKFDYIILLRNKIKLNSVTVITILRFVEIIRI